MKKIMKKIAPIALSAALVLGGATTSLAVDYSVSMEDMTISASQVNQGSVDLSNIKMTSSDNLKWVTFESGAVTAAASKGELFVINMDEVSLTIDPAAIMETAEWQKMSTQGGSYRLEVVVELNQSVNIQTAFPTTTQSALGASLVSSYGIGFEIFIKNSYQTEYLITEFTSPVVLTYNYEKDYNSWSQKKGEELMALAWADVDRDMSGYEMERDLFESLVDVDENTVTILAPYGTGTYLLVSETGADNTQTVLDIPTKEVVEGDLNGDGVVDGNDSALSSWAASDIANLQSAGILPSDLSNVDLNSQICRDEFTAYLVGVAKASLWPDYVSPFTDISTSYYQSKILVAASNGLVNGKTETTFEPLAKITRQEIATLFMRAIEFSNKEVATDDSVLDKFADKDSISAWAVDGAAAVTAAGIIGGKTETTFAPLDNVTWAEAAAMLNRFNTYLQ